MRVLSFRPFLTLRQIQNFHMASMLQIEFPSQIVIHLRFKSIDFQAGPEGCVMISVPITGFSIK